MKIEKSITSHTTSDDVYGMVLGAMFFSLGIYFLHFSGLITGGVAGMALLISWFTPIPIGYLFILVNIPFIIFAIFKMGISFTIKTLIVNILLFSFSITYPHIIKIEFIDPLFSAVLGGTMIGVGILFLVRHNSSAGGTVILTLWIQKKYGINAGKVQMFLDVIIFALSVIKMPWTLIIISIISGVAMNGMMIAWHKPGRYQG